jgi:cytochrome c oxidase assembly protein subunit 11
VNATAAGNPSRTALLAAGLAVAMAGLAFASVPLYRIFCQVTGFGGTTQVAAAAPTADAVARAAGRTIKVRFDGNVNGVPWSFAPVEGRTETPIGEQRLAFYRATNSGPLAVTGTATFNVSPVAAGKYFVKIQCFCFNEQTLKPGETVDMPVVWYVDPAILDDPDAAKIDEITLSYTFFPVTEPTKAPGIYATGQQQVAHRAG